MDLPVMKIDFKEPQGYEIRIDLMGNEIVYPGEISCLSEALECGLIFKEQWEKESFLRIPNENILVSMACIENNKGNDLDAYRVSKEIKKRGVNPAIVKE